jgi:hypothetical protein
MSAPFFSECRDCKREFRIDSIPPRCPYCGVVQQPPAAPKAETVVPSRSPVR